MRVREGKKSEVTFSLIWKNKRDGEGKGREFGGIHFPSLFNKSNPLIAWKD